MNSMVRGVLRVAGLGFLTAVAGCASASVSVPGFSAERTDDHSTYSERVALNDAAEQLSVQPWGDIERAGVVSVLFGTVAKNVTDRNVDDYLDSPGEGRRATGAILADADHSLAEARRVVEAGRQAVDAITPVSSDIAVLERALADTRECQRFYTTALKKAGADARTVREVRDAFGQTIDDMSLTADLVAERVAETADRPRYASPAAPSLAAE